MGYDICIAAAGVPVLGYREDGSYQGSWAAYTAGGFYVGEYGSCTGCDWREAEHCKVPRDGPRSERNRIAASIDAAIGRKIIEAAALDLLAFVKWADSNYLSDRDGMVAWGTALAAALIQLAAVAEGEVKP